MKATKSRTQYTIYNCYSPTTENLPLDGIDIQDDHCIVVGDFNSHSPSWGYKDLDARGEEMENWITDNNVQLLMNEDDRDTFFSRAWKTTSNPDLALLSDDLIANSERKVLHQLAGSDHLPILLKVIEKSQSNAPQPPPRWNYKKANWTKFSQLSDNYTQNINCKSKRIDDTARKFTAAILKAAKEAIPRGSRKNYCPGWTDELDILNNEVTECRENVEKNPTDEHVNAYKAAEAKLRTEIIQNKRTAWHEKTKQLDYDKQGRKLWNLVKTLNGEENRYAVPSVEDEQGNILNQRQAANCLIQQYKKVGEIDIDYSRKQEVQREIATLNRTEPTKETSHETMSKNITKEEVYAALKSLKTNKAPGPDDITNDMLMKLGNSALKK